MTFKADHEERIDLPEGDQIKSSFNEPAWINLLIWCDSSQGAIWFKKIVQNIDTIWIQVLISGRNTKKLPILIKRKLIFNSSLDISITKRSDVIFINENLSDFCLAFKRIKSRQINMLLRHIHHCIRLWANRYPILFALNRILEIEGENIKCHWVSVWSFGIPKNWRKV